MAGTTTYYGISYPTSTDYVKDGAAAIQTVATGFDSAVAIPTYNAQTGTTYTFVLSDTGKTVTASNAGSQTYTIPPTASVAWAANTTLRVINLGAGVVTFAAGAGVTVTNTAQTLTQYQSANLVRTGLNAWTVTPDSGPASTTGLTLISTASFSAVSSVSLAASSFTSTYRNYKILLNATYSVDTALRGRLRVGGTDNTTSNYIMQNLRASSTTFSASRASTTIWEFQETATGTASGVIEIFSPQETALTRLTFHFSGAATTTAEIANIGNGFFNATTSFDSATFSPASGTMTGTYSLYGYNI